jgi:ATP-dependent HslUV protease ATP-binding subunit HslU
MEKLLEELSFGTFMADQEKVVIDAAYVNQRLGELAADEDLSRYVL